MERSSEQIEAEIANARANLALTLDVLAERVKPTNVLRRQQARARGLVQTPDGHWKTRNLAIAAGAAAVLAAYVIRRARL